MKFVAVDVAAEHGGALTVLRSFVEAAAASEHEWVVYVSEEQEKRPGVRFRVFPWVKRSWLHRLWFDFIVLPLRVRQEGPAAVLSLQNVAVPFWKGNQAVYLHQSLPFVDARFDIRREPKLWVYQNLISRLILRSARRARFVIVQTAWMKRAVLERVKGLPEGRVVVQPYAVEAGALDFDWLQDAARATFFYPANGETYKNHQLLIEASRILEREGHEFTLVLTLEPGQLQEARMTALPKAVRFVGRLDRREMAQHYARSALVFPSLVESSPLPLAEAASGGAVVLASDLPFSREVLGDYRNAHFFDADSPEALAGLMAEYLRGELTYFAGQRPARQPGSGFDHMVSRFAALVAQGQGV